jgi:hypothetical protein
MNKFNRRTYEIKRALIDVRVKLLARAFADLIKEEQKLEQWREKHTEKS